MNRKKKMNQRLIDANKIEFNTVRYPIGAPWPFNKEEQATMGEIEWVSKYQIENQPTVEAIPIEWLEERLEHFHKLYDWAVADKNKYKEQVYSKAINELSELLDDWREENETN